MPLAELAAGVAATAAAPAAVEVEDETETDAFYIIAKYAQIFINKSKNKCTEEEEKNRFTFLFIGPAFLMMKLCLRASRALIRFLGNR